MLDLFVIQPTQGVFDLSKLIARVESLPTVVPFPRKEPVNAQGKPFPLKEYIVCHDLPTAQVLHQLAAGWHHRHDIRDGVAGYGVSGYLGVDPDQIKVDQLAPQSVIEQMADLLLLILRTQPCRIFAELAEVTREYEGKPERLFD
jgi:hypothetical protein